MSDEQGNCPGCGSESGPREGWQKIRWECGSNIELSEFGDSAHFYNEEFKQSDLCKLRQRDQLIAECLQVMEDYELRHQFDCLGDVVTGDPPPGWRGCKCGATSKLAAIKSRAERLNT